jgi:glycosyltransferase involved in cell wall biosynthesis
MLNKIFNELTIIVPVYNSVKTINRVLDLLANLKSKNIRILISDNNSSDGTKEILKQYEKLNYFEIFYQDENIGCKSTKFLISKVETPYILPIGSDDYLIDYSKLDIAMNMLKNNPSAVGCSFKASFIYDKKFVADKTNVALTGDTNKRFKKLFYYFGANSRYYGIIKTDLFRKYYPKESYFGDDAVLSSRILKHGEWLYTSEINLHRERGGSSNPFKINKSHNFIFIPPLRFAYEMLSIEKNFSIGVKLAFSTYFLKILIGPIKHILYRR